MPSRKKENANQAKEVAQKARTTKPSAPGLVAADLQLDPLVLQRALADPAVASPPDIVALQRVAGNQAVTQLIQAQPSAPIGRQLVQQQAEEEEEPVQTKPTPYRQEGDQTDLKTVNALSRDSEEGEDLLRASGHREGSPSGSALEERSNALDETSNPVMAKAQFNLGTPGDVYEQEADHVAEQVARNVAAPKTGGGGLFSNRIQNKVSKQGMSLLHNLTGTSQRVFPPVKRDGSGVLRISRLDRSGSQTKRTIPSSLGERIAQSKDRGSALPPAIQADLSNQLGHDFSSVKVKTDSEAADLTARLGAKAFTNGPDIWMGRGESVHDVKLMAHELTHVVQQGAAPKLTPKRSANLEGAPTSTVLNHLQAMFSSDSPTDASVYRDQVRGFLRENDSDTVTLLRRQILEAPRADSIAHKDKANSVRLAACGGKGTPTSFPTIGTITSDSNVKAARKEDWTGGEGDFLERSGWVNWNATDNTFKVVGRKKGDEFGVDPGATPADNPPVYCVGHYHTHPPLSKKMKKERKDYWKSKGAEMYPVAPSDADKNFANGRDNPGAVEDFVFASRWPSWLRKDYYYGPKRRSGAPEGLEEEGEGS